VRDIYYNIDFFCVYGMVNWLIYGWLPTFLKDHFHSESGRSRNFSNRLYSDRFFAGVILGGILADIGQRII